MEYIIIIASFILYIFFISLPYIIMLIFIKIINSLKRKLINKSFKNNVVVNKKIEEKTGKGNKYQRTYIDVPKNVLAKYNMDDINLLKDFFYKMFLEFENAYNDLDYNTMKILCTKQLYYNYSTAIKLNLQAGEKRIIKDIKKEKVIIYQLLSTSYRQCASLMIEISYIDYTINKNGYVIKGRRDKKINEKFEVDFIKKFEKEEIVKCPNCGAQIEGNKCNFCRTIVKDEEFKISSIRKIIEE